MPTLKWTYLQCMLRLLEAVEAVWLERKIGAKLGVVIFYWRYFARVWVVSVVIVIRWGRKAVSPTTKETNCMIHRHLDENNYQLWLTFSLLLSNNRHHCNNFVRPLHTLNFNDWILEKIGALWFDRKIAADFWFAQAAISSDFRFRFQDLSKLFAAHSFSRQIRIKIIFLICNKQLLDY